MPDNSRQVAAKGEARWFVALAALGLAGLALSASLAPTGATKAVSGPVEQRWFTHEKHVYAAWNLDAETPRDCQGCHHYEPGVPLGQLARPAESCSRCHDPDGDWQRKKGRRFDTGESRIDPSSEEQALFKHAAHNNLKCAECHLRAESNGGWLIAIPTEDAENKAYCIRCHDPESKDAQALSADALRKRRDSFNHGLTQDAERRAQTASVAPVFSHAAHLTPEELVGEDPQTCLRCHESVRNARPDSLGEQQFDTKACVGCHVGMRFSAELTEPDGSKIRRISATAGVFDHKPHLRLGVTHEPQSKASQIGFELLAQKRCLACHVFESEPSSSNLVRTFTLESRFSGDDAQQACVVCHEQWNDPNHGDIDRCAECHRIEPGSLTTRANMTGNRPVDAVHRADPANFSFQVQSHVLIAGERAGSWDSQACSECHVARLEQQPSRIGIKPFSHATHVDPRNTNNTAACLACHATVGAASSLKDQRLVPASATGEMSINYEPQACVACHGEGAAVPRFEPTPRTSALRFDHRAHLAREFPPGSGETLECSACHVTSRPDEATEITLKDKVMDCTLCHGHVRAPDKVVPKFDKNMVASCVECHIVGVPAKGEDVLLDGAKLVVDSAGWQIHSGTQSCKTCHRALPSGTVVPRMEPRRRVSTTLLSGETPHLARNDLVRPQHFEDQIDCIDCHWHDMVTHRPDKRLRDHYLQTIQRIAPQRLEKAKLSADTKKYREVYGAELKYKSGSDVFPGLTPNRQQN